MERVYSYNPRARTGQFYVKLNNIMKPEITRSYVPCTLWRCKLAPMY